MHILLDEVGIYLICWECMFFFLTAALTCIHVSDKITFPFVSYGSFFLFFFLPQSVPTSVFQFIWTDNTRTGNSHDKTTSLYIFSFGRI